MIYQRFGRWWGLSSLIDLELVNSQILVTEFAAIDLALNKLGVEPRIGVPLAAGDLVLIAVSRWRCPGTGGVLIFRECTVFYDLCLGLAAGDVLAFGRQPERARWTHRM